MADFGYKVEGATKHTLYNNNIYGCRYAGAAGIGISITWNLKQYSAYTPTIKFALYDAENNFVENSETEEWVLTEGWDGEKTLLFISAPTLTAQNYRIAIWVGVSYVYSYYDAGETAQMESENRTYNGFPAHLDWLGSSTDRKETVYCTYTPAGGATHYGAATLAGVGTLAGTPHAIFIGKSALSGVGALAGIGRLIAIGKATLAGVGSLTASAVSILIGKATLSGVGTLSAIGTIKVVLRILRIYPKVVTAWDLNIASALMGGGLTITDKKKKALEIKGSFQGG